MKLPAVVIVGRPNVGKSTLFNSLVRKRIAVVEPTSGVTRDRISAIVSDTDGSQFELVDTGGMGGAGLLASEVEQQIGFAVARADVLLFVVDGAQGMVPQDQEIAARIRRVGKPIVLVANKVESRRNTAAAAEFYRLGMGEPMLISALHKTNTGDLRTILFDLAAGAKAVGPSRPEMKIAVVGRRNTGKSTFINALAKEPRVIVSEMAGTTRDSIDVRLERDGKVVIAIDTAGLQKKQRVGHAIDFYSRVRAQESIRRADVALLMLDPESKISRLDKNIANYIYEYFKPCIIVVNKWDLVKGARTADYAEYLAAELTGLRRAPISFVSAIQSKGVQRTVDLARSLWKQSQVRVPTAKLNQAIEKLKTRPQTGGKAAKRPKIYYATQTGVEPPTIVLFVNTPEYFSASYRRAIGSFLARQLPFSQVPIDVRYKKAARRER